MQTGPSNAWAVILAAGLSRRMGPQNKLLMDWRGKPLISHICNAALESRCSNTLVVTGHEAEQVINAVKTDVATKDGITFVQNSEYRTGIAASIRIAIGELNKQHRHNRCERVVILLGDMPHITAPMIDRLIEASENSDDLAIVFASCQGRRGNPVVWPRYYFDKLLQLKGDRGAKQIIDCHQDQIVEVELGEAARFDLDTMAEFQATD